MKNKQILLSLLLLPLVFVLSACGKTDETPVTKPVPVNIKGQTIEQSLMVKQSLNYPGMIVSDSEANIIAKTGGTLTSVKFKVGDKVALGQELAKIDDVNSSSFVSSSFNTNQIKQARNVVASAEAGYNLAKDNYNSVLISSVKDLRSAEIARDQAAKGQSNLDITTGESVKSAELAYETAKIATEQARTTLENREKLAVQNSQDTLTNADLTVSSVISTAGAVMTNINNVTSFDDDNKVSISYRQNLGALDANSYDNAKQAYQKASEASKNYSGKKFNNISERVAGSLEVANAVKDLCDQTKNLFDKSISSASLPQTSLSGTSLSGLQTAVAGYQSQMNAAVNQLNSTKQALTSVDLNNSTLLDSLRQAYKISQQQEASAKQALASLKSGNTSQQNQAGFNVNLAQNQFENTKIKIESQVNSLKTQLETAQLQYNNAITSLQSLYDAHSVIAPINGTITKLAVAEGQTVGQGQIIATISQPENLKVQFYVEADNLLDIRLASPVKIIDANNVVYMGAISAISPQADVITRRFLVEVKLENSVGLLLGTVVNVNLDIVKNRTASDLIILPLSAITVGQNGNTIFIVENNQAKKVAVELKEVIGEYAQVKANLPSSTMIVIEGNRLLQEGQSVNVTQ